ncbi:lysophospholipid acyltransferase family protein [Anaeromyxobacter oryzisoli]|uniref:lysophospholipid acyltransferase family protein n=1 Tax=Anaeromyxobacter oryzisoli TaxID=2925408 RepID=UPI001F57A024|nr:lysophospholipid acyltransferase family protein [Anaeromyxobacter sp. SG63]
MRWLVQIVRRVVFTGGAFLLFFAVGALLSYAVLPLARRRAGSPERGAARCRRIVRRTWIAFHDYMRWCGLLHYEPRATRLELPPSGAVLVANHPTLVDVTALVTAAPDLVFVAKRQMFRNLLVGPLLRACGHIESDVGIFSGAAVVEEAVARLERGCSVLVFPEGTRSPKGAIGPFFSGAFEIAVRANVPIVPVLIRSDPPALIRGQRWHEIPERTVRLTVTQLATVPPPLGRAAVARDQVRSIYVELLQRAASGEAAAIPPPSPAALEETTWKSWSVRSSSSSSRA